MRSSILLCLIPAAFCAAASPSRANVTISNAPTVNMTCSGGVCSPTAADAVLNVQDLAAMLASGNATVTTTGAGVQATDIHIDARLSWSAATALALDAYRSIEVNAKLTVAGTGGVSLTTNDGGSGGEFACNDHGRLEFGNLSSALTINGAAYTLVNSVASLAAAIAANPSGAFALANNYNAKKDGTYATSPVSTTLSGLFDGLGNTISNLSVNDPTENAYVGLFAETTGTIANVRLVNESVQGSGSSGGVVGGLVGSSGGTIAHSFTAGTVSGGDSDGSVAGGLVGLVGLGGPVTGSGSTAAVSGGTAGGLVGIGGAISDSWATGNVSGSYHVGGLAGFLGESDIKHAWASGEVSVTGGSQSSGGGLVGVIQRSGSIERSYASGAVTGQGTCGGLLGSTSLEESTIRISQTYATGNVTTTNGLAGGLVGDSYFCSTCEIANSYATGTASGLTAGGLVGWSGITVPHHTISSSYATGAVAGTSEAGGLIGDDGFGPYNSFARTYWDMTTSGITNRSQGAGNVANDPGIKGLSNKKLKSGLPEGFSPKLWNEDSSINGGLPYLINNPPKS